MHLSFLSESKSKQSKHIYISVGILILNVVRFILTLLQMNLE